MQLIPQPSVEEAEILALFDSDKKWITFDGYLQRCFDVVVAQLGLPESPRDSDQVYKGMKLAFEHMAQIPAISKEVLQAQEKEKKEEEDDITL